ncbi:hypothetical protein GECvBN7_gp021c [Salmonella phage GEC_vB_N7]|uniref:Uncharacterized protein n=1 Tax=Salmonella phage GEC_vB_N7 TaxID=2777380 RepID=A0A7S9SSA3_9CAUD|nr:hypothetical protein GECvBN7_gp021c [Salmonella phage GEC_vB_N7]
MNNSNIALKRSQTHSNAFIFGGRILITGNSRKARKSGADSCAPLLLVRYLMRELYAFTVGIY